MRKGGKSQFLKTLPLVAFSLAVGNSFSALGDDPDFLGESSTQARIADGHQPNACVYRRRTQRSNIVSPRNRKSVSFAPTLFCYDIDGMAFEDYCEGGQMDTTFVGTQMNTPDFGSFKVPAIRKESEIVFQVNENTLRELHKAAARCKAILNHIACMEDEGVPADTGLQWPIVYGDNEAFNFDVAAKEEFK